jgi:hypothetical protein
VNLPPKPWPAPQPAAPDLYWVNTQWEQIVSDGVDRFVESQVKEVLRRRQLVCSLERMGRVGL